MLGVAYKRDTADIRESPALRILGELRRAGADVSYHDPHVPRLGRGRHYHLDLESVPLDAATLGSADAVLILTDHSAVDYHFVAEHARLVVDTRNAMRLVVDGQERSSGRRVVNQESYIQRDFEGLSPSQVALTRMGPYPEGWSGHEDPVRLYGERGTKPRGRGDRGGARG